MAAVAEERAEDPCRRGVELYCEELAAHELRQLVTHSNGAGQRKIKLLLHESTVRTNRW